MRMGRVESSEAESFHVDLWLARIREIKIQACRDVLAHPDATPDAKRDANAWLMMLHGVIDSFTDSNGVERSAKAVAREFFVMRTAAMLMRWEVEDGVQYLSADHAARTIRPLVPVRKEAPVERRSKMELAAIERHRKAQLKLACTRFGRIRGRTMR